MILGVFSLLQRRPAVAITPAERETLERDGARALNWARSRGARRIRRRLLWHAAIFAICLGGVVRLQWSPSSVLAFVLLNALVGLLIDFVRVFLVQRSLEYSHGREYRAEQILEVAAARGGQRFSPRPRPRVLPSFALSVLAVAITWLAMLYLHRLGWRAAFGSPLLPVTLFVASTLRVILAVQEIRLARLLTVGSRETYLEADDTISAHVPALAVAILAWPMGELASLVGALLVAAAPAAYWAARWWWLRQSSAALYRHVRQSHPELATRPVEEDTRDEF